MGREYNSRARLTNNSLGGFPGAHLVPLRTSDNREVVGFPATQGDIDSMSCWSPLPALLDVVNVSIDSWRG